MDQLARLEVRPDNIVGLDGADWLVAEPLPSLERVVLVGLDPRRGGSCVAESGALLR